MKSILLSFLMTFLWISIAFAQPANDSIVNAIDVSSIINSCSSDAAYTTVNATSDTTLGSCSNGSGYNVWFKFEATAATMSVLVDIGGSKGTMLRTNASIFEANGVNEVACNRYVNNGDNVYVEATNLTVGDTFYISVDNNYSGYRGTFTLCLNTSLTNDYLEGATDVSSFIGSCSSDAAYTTIGATMDQSDGSCSNGSGYNRWFKFQATSPFMNVKVDIGGAQGTMLRTNVTMWKASDTTEVVCNRYVSNNDDVEIAATTLIVGDWYFISVDNNYSGYRGTFTLCIDTSVSYDYLEGAIDVSSFIGSCSLDAAYTTVGATMDQSDGSCSDGSGYNRWFKFQATSPFMNIKVDIGGTKGTMLRTNVTMWKASDTSEVVCNRYVSNGDDVEIASTTLNTGDWYFISVDNNYSGYRGTFTLCLDTSVSYDYLEGALDVSSYIGSCSPNAAFTTVGATMDQSDGSCSDGSGYNRWFKFQATSPFMNIKVDIGGTKGTMLRTNVTMWKASDTSEVVCNRYVNNNDDVEIASTTLNTGDWYFVSVDNNYSGYRGTFTLCLDTTVSYDYYEGAKDITAYLGSCTPDAAYTTVGATMDKFPGSCSNGSGYNRWFKFQAVSPELNLKVDIGGSKGTMLRTNATIWQANGTTQVACNRYVNNNDDVEIDVTSLVSGDWYYISIDNNYSGYRGTFTLCLDTTPSYDYYEGAIELTDLNNYCSPDASYTTIGATMDKFQGSCNNGSGYNRWFKFTAIDSSVTYTIKRGGAFGTILRINTALWEGDGTTQVACDRYAANTDDVSITYPNLTPGNVYYISVDNNYSGYRGTFTICIDNVGTEYYAIASGDWNVASTWSLTSGGSTAPTAPGTGDIVYIDGYNVTVSANDTCAEVNITTTSGPSILDIDGVSLSVMGQVNLTNSGSTNLGVISLLTGSNLNINDNLNITRSGGSGILSVTVVNSSLSINSDLNFTTSGGTSSSNGLLLSGGTMVVNGDINITHTSGVATDINLNTTSNAVCYGNFNMSATADDKINLTLNTIAEFTFYKGITQGSPEYGNITSNGNSTIKLLAIQPNTNIPTNSSVGTTDQVTYSNLVLSSPNPVTSTFAENLTVNKDLFILGSNYGIEINGKVLLVKGNLINNGTVSLTNNGALVQTNSSNGNTGTGTYNVDRLGGKTGLLQYNIWSSPVMNQNIGTAGTAGAFTGSNACDIFTYETPTSAWLHDYTAGSTAVCAGNSVTFSAAAVIPGADGLMDSGRGYFVTGDGSSTTRTFTGTVHNGDLSYSLVSGTDDANLMGNPYPSALDLDWLWKYNADTTSSISGGIYFWDDPVGVIYDEDDDYATYNAIGFVASTNTGSNGPSPDPYIASCQGFWVYATGTGNLDFKNAMRDSTVDNSQFFKAESKENEVHKAWFTSTTPSGISNTILIGYNSESTDGKDASYDAPKLSGNDHIKFASMIDTEEFIIQGISAIAIGDSKVIPLVLFTDETGNHTFSEIRRENLSTAIVIYIRDLETGTTHNLASGNYEVALAGNITYTNRFELVFVNTATKSDDATTSNGKDDIATGINDVNQNNFTLIPSSNGYTLMNDNGIHGDIQVVDVTGKIVWVKNNNNGNNQINIDLNNVVSGIYFIQLSNNGERMYSNKVVKN